MKSYKVTRLSSASALFTSFPEEIRPGVTVNFLGEVDLENIERVRNSCRKAGLPAPSYTAFVIKAAALGLHNFSYANRRLFSFPFLGRRMQIFDNVDATVLCERDLPEAPMAAFAEIIRKACELPLVEIHARLKTLVNCTQETNSQWRSLLGLVRNCPGWLARLLCKLPIYLPGWWVKYRGGALVVSSPAKYGVDVVQASWPWPIAFSFGLAQKQVVLRNNKPAVGKVFILSLNFDRRIMAGAQAARFFKYVRNLLTNPDQHMLQGLPKEIFLDSKISERNFDVSFSKSPWEECTKAGTKIN